MMIEEEVSGVSQSPVRLFEMHAFARERDAALGGKPSQGVLFAGLSSTEAMFGGYFIGHLGNGKVRGEISKSKW